MGERNARSNGTHTQRIKALNWSSSISELQYPGSVTQRDSGQCSSVVWLAIFGALLRVPSSDGCRQHGAQRWATAREPMQPNQRRLHPARSASPPFGSSGSLKPAGGVSFCVEGVNGRKPSQETRPPSASSASSGTGGRQRGSPLGLARKQPTLPKKSPSRAPGDVFMQREASCSGSSETSVDDAMSSMGIGVSSPPMMLALLQATDAPLARTP